MKVPNSFRFIAVYPEAAEATVATRFNHLFAVIVVSSKIPVTGCICKESVKVCTPEAPATAYDPALDVAALNIQPQCPRTQL